ncbi:RagB/SusD family nutrient uptake outer membrane protein [Hymenobacter psychrotolerans]|uniref:SusD family protein n=1 Tax=Hymenobacter psychrotolerans DSM 18569 TaxID=1121959 RepID=A0A1M6PIP4_9BACT|nr:RagB/SusD family nutrient uptake outer membrane protein [Hymenobacter psychrotolerans]SHK07774.1 SusD family protein [Hymenobacter psychrotolerans DSM 18569]
MTTIKKKITGAACFLLVGLGTFSCKDELLDPVPQTTFNNQVVFETPARIALQVNSLYSYLKVGNFLGGRYQVYGDIRADDFLNKTSNLVTGTSVWNHTVTEQSQNDVINLWTAAYQAINQINVFLVGMDANMGKFVAPAFPADFATTTAVNYKAEARLLRALSYYSLLQLYARPYVDGNGSKPGLPLRLQAETGNTGNDLARSTVAEVYAQILEDLNYAEQNLPLTYTDASLRVTRAHRNTAIALKTRVYLTMANYAKVIEEANKIVSAAAPFAAPSGVAHTLTIATVFTTPQETPESVLSFPFTAQNAPGTQNQLGFYFSNECSLNPAGILGNPAWAATDVRRTSFVVTNTAGTESLLSRKYPTPSPYTDKAPVIRYAEVLLSLAEARVRTVGATDARALALLNAVRGRSNPAGVYTSFADATAATNAILLERRIEFLGEGIRNIDLMRLNATIPGKGSVGAVPPSSPLYVWPIPNTELAANALMTRN